MSIIKSFSVGLGDMFYIKHGSDNFTIIDCCLSDDNKDDIVNELIDESKGKGIIRFISTHPDEDHIKKLDYLDDQMNLLNFYCVKNEATKIDESEGFNRYCELRDSEKKSYYISRGCSRKWMNKSNEERSSSGINILWPKTGIQIFKDELEKAKNGESPNNISPIIEYSLDDGVKIIWMGDLEKDFMEEIKNEITLPKIDILFAPHHGRKSGKLPIEWIDQMDPEIIVMGEANSNDSDYASYPNNDKIRQNSAGDIIFECEAKKVHIYVSNENYTVDFLDNENKSSYDNYIGTLNIV